MAVSAVTYLVIEQGGRAVVLKLKARYGSRQTAGPAASPACGSPVG
jgi:hypothetical protein